MYNLFLSLAAGAVVALAIAFGTSYGWVAAVFPGFLVADLGAGMLDDEDGAALGEVGAKAGREHLGDRLVEQGGAVTVPEAVGLGGAGGGEEQAGKGRQAGDLHGTEVRVGEWWNRMTVNQWPLAVSGEFQTRLRTVAAPRALKS